MTSEIESYDILVFGGGKGGKSLAMDRARAGLRVAVIEAGMIGGSCINIACIPTKALIRSAEMVAAARHLAPFGIDAGTLSIDMERVAARTAGVVAEMVEYNRAAFESSGLELVIGWGRFVEARVIEVKTDTGIRRLTAPRIYLNLGTKAAIPDIPGLLASRPLTHVEALTLTEIPADLIVIGGGYIGLEMAQAFRRLGSRVTILERGPVLASREDEDVSAAITALLESEDIVVATDAGDLTVSGVSGDAVTVHTGDGRSFAGTHILVAAGRIPMTEDIGLDIAGVSLSSRGYILVDDRLRSSATGIFAIGEVAGTPQFTHASFDDFRVAKSELSGGTRTTTGRLIPSCLFLDPELARVGLNEKEASAQGLPYRIARLAMDIVPRARTMSARKGFMKCLLASDSDRILGFTMLGERAGEVMTIVQTAMLGDLPFTMLRDAIIAHPTLAEGLNMLFANIPPRDA